MLEVNFIAIAVCSVLGIFMGFIWYSKGVFGKVWGEVMGFSMDMSKEEMAKASKGMGKVVLIQFVALFVQLYVLANVIGMNKLVYGDNGALSGMGSGFWVWLGFILPTVIGALIWSGKSNKLQYKWLWVSGLFQLISMLLFGLILGAW